MGAGSDANLLALSVDAARAEATVGEISLALEQVFGRHQARPEGVHGGRRPKSLVRRNPAVGAGIGAGPQSPLLRRSRPTPGTGPLPVRRLSSRGGSEA